MHALRKGRGRSNQSTLLINHMLQCPKRSVHLRALSLKST